MLEIIPDNKDRLDSLLKKYKKKLDKISLIKKQKTKQTFEKKSTMRRKKVQNAILRERYKRTHELT